MKLQLNNLILVAAGALIFLIASSCSDERTAPTVPEEPSYNQSIVLFDRATAAGVEKSKSFTLRDSVVSGKLYLYGFLKPDAGLNMFEQYGLEIDGLKKDISDLDGQIINIQIKVGKTHADSLAMDSLKVIVDSLTARKDIRTGQRDSLDIVLDDRFKISVRLDDDTIAYYPNAVLLDTSLAPFLAPKNPVWGQGFYLNPPNQQGWRGMKIALDLAQFWVADAGWDTGDPYCAKVKPARGVLPELYPIRSWIKRLTPNSSHKISVTFGSAGSLTEMSATLFVVYKTAQ